MSDFINSRVRAQSVRNMMASFCDDKENKSTEDSENFEVLGIKTTSDFTRRKSSSSISEEVPLSSSRDGLNSRPRRRSSIGVTSYKVIVTILTVLYTNNTNGGL